MVSLHPADLTDWHDYTDPTDTLTLIDLPTVEQSMAEQFDVDPNVLPIGITRDELADHLADTHYLPLVREYSAIGGRICPDPEAEACYEISHAADVLHPWIATIHQEQGT